MTGIFGHWPLGAESGASVVRQMAAALRTYRDQHSVTDTESVLTVGALERRGDSDSPWRAETSDGTGVLWVAGEVFSTRAPLLASESPEPPIWHQLLADGFAVLGPAALNGLNGDFQMAFWNRKTRQLTLAVDRFCTSPLYWAANRAGFSFAFGVRGVLMAPEVECRPDFEAIRQAVTFGGYRLGSRTNVRDVQMLRPAQTLWVDDAVVTTARTYWHWADMPADDRQSVASAIEELRPKWRAAVQRRLQGTRRPGQTLSGGRDSRVILAEGAAYASSWKAFSYGVPGCDDARFAQQAAAAVGADYEFLPLYRREPPDWLERRTAHIQHTDGLIGLIDLMHLENQAELVDHVDCLLPGFVGDAIIGTTFDHVHSDSDATVALAFLGSPLSMRWDDAVQSVRDYSHWESQGATVATIFEHKIPQAIARPNTALATAVRVRRPFIDVDLVDFVMPLSPKVRANLYDHWVLSTYPRLFARIPVQKTGARVGSSAVGLAGVRVGRRINRAFRRVRGAIGLSVAPFSRTYTADETEAAKSGIRERIEGVILAPQSTVVELWGRQAVTEVLADWFDRGRGASQVVGALYTWEAYHRGVSAHLRDSAKQDS